MEVEYRVTNFTELHEAFKQYDSGEYLFRGVYDMSYKLIPKIGRISGKDMDLFEYENLLMKQFRRWAFPFLDKTPKNEWEVLAIAQHHGLPTRLLDWTRNPMVAAYFSVNKNYNDDSIIYIIKDGSFDSNIEFDVQDPYIYDEEDNEVRIYEPDHITQRIVAQNGLFTIHNNPKIPLEEIGGVTIDKIVIDKNCRDMLKQTLDFYGIHKASLFPGLDGITEYLQKADN